MMDLYEFFRIGMDRKITPLEERASGPRINLGQAAKVMPPYVTSIGLPEWNAETDPLPYEDNSIGEIWALHFLEHIDNVLMVLSECQRVMQPGAVMNITVPYGSGHLACQDLGHRHFFNEGTWATAFRNPYYAVAGDKGLAPWKFRVGTNVIMGIKGENLALMTQLIKEA